MLERLKNKDDAFIINALTSITRNPSFGVYPKVLVQDNGKEWVNEQVMSFCKSNGTKQVFGLPYNPKPNALTESTNNIIRSVMRSLFIHTASLN